MKNLKVSSKELQIIEAGLHLVNVHNIKLLTENISYQTIRILCEENKCMIDNLIDKVVTTLKQVEADKEANPSLTMTLKLDTTEFNDSLRRLSEKLLAVSKI